MPKAGAVALSLWIVAGAAANAQPEDAAQPTASSASQAHPIWLFGNDEILWICQARTVDGASLLRFAYRENSSRGPTTYRALPIDTIVGRIEAAAARGRDLHVFFRDGSHRRYAPSPTVPSRIAQPMFTVELILPGGAVPRALTADPEQDILYALVSSRDAAKIEAEAAEREAQLRDEDEEAAEDENPPPPQPARDAREGPAARAASDLAVVHYDGSSWIRGRDGPPQLDRDDSLRAFLVYGAQVHILYSELDGQDAIVHQYSPDIADGWSRPALVSAPPGVRILAAGWAEGVPLLAMAEPVAGGVSMRLAGWQEHEWSDRTVLKSADGQAQVFDAILAAEVYGDTAVVARLGKDGTPELAAWSIVTGEPIRPFELVSPLAPVGAPHLRPATRTFVSYLVLMALLAAVVIWRRERIVVPAPLTPDQVFAALSARVTAVLIDLLITAPVWGPIAFWAWSGADGLAALANWTDPSAVPSTATIWTPALIGAIYAVYAAAFELAIRTTPGKRIMRCTVVAEGGEPCSAKAVLIRNAARIVEFHFAAVALLVVLTPSRQRLGDILAKTVVTQPTPPEPEAGEHFSDGSGFPDDQAR